MVGHHRVQVATESGREESPANREVLTESLALTMPGSVGNTNRVLVTDAEGVVEHLQPASTRNPATLLPAGFFDVFDVVLPFSDRDEHETARSAGQNRLRRRHPIPSLRIEGIESEVADQSEASDVLTRSELENLPNLREGATGLRCLCHGHNNLLGRMRRSLDEFQFVEHTRRPMS